MTAFHKRIHWDDDDKQQVTVATMEFLKEHPTVSLLNAVRIAQQVLPEDKRRPLRTTGDIGKWMEKSLANERALQAASPPPEPPPPPPPEQPNILATVNFEDLTRAWFDRLFHEYITPQLMTLANDLFAAKMSMLLSQVQSQTNENGRMQLVVPNEIRKRIRTKVLVFGLIGSQITTIKQRFDDPLDLTFIQADHNHDGLISLAKSNDVAIVMTRFVSHPQQDKVRNNAPHTVLVSGSTSDLTNILNSLVNVGMDKVAQHNFSQKSFAA
jgi:hypothetical protein